ncbi:MAG: hypothetical protein ABIF10_04135 [Candidatus Woesearchaeota archaeon]
MHTNLVLKSKDIDREPAKLYRNSHTYSLYIPLLVSREVLHRPKHVFPSVVEYEDKKGLAFYFEPPKDYDLKPYKIYYIKRKDRIFTYIPIPKDLKYVVVGSGNPLVKYTIGFDDHDRQCLFLERAFK